MFQPTDAELKALRAGGVTTVGLVFNGGIFPGRIGAAFRIENSYGYGNKGRQDENTYALPQRTVHVQAEAEKCKAVRIQDHLS